MIDDRTYEALPLRPETWYEPGRGDTKRGAAIQARLAEADHEVDAHSIAHAWLRYSAKHCPDSAAAAEVLREITEHIIRAATRLNAIGGCQ